MATIGGPNTEKDNLVFGYDTGYGVADNNTATRFYAGKTADNEFYNSGANGNILDHSSGYGGIGTFQPGVLDASGTTENKVYRKTGKIRFGPTGGQDIGTLVYGNTYTFSIYLRHVPGETQMSGGEFDIVDQSSGGKNFTGTLGSNMTYEWKRFSVTNTHTNSSNYHFIDLGTYQGTNVFEWCMPQIEQGTVMSPFTNTERSSTQSLIDLKRTTGIDVSNVSFDSTGQPTFDGTNDKIVIPADSFSNIGTSDFTVELVFKNTKTSNYSHFFSVKDQYHFALKMSNTGDRNIYVYRDSALSTYTAITANAPSSTDYYYLVCKREGDNLELYLNGVSKGTKSGWNSIDIENDGYATSIGTHGTSSEFTGGEIPVLKLHNKALTAAEIKQNYNAYKNRFNI